MVDTEFTFILREPSLESLHATLRLFRKIQKLIIYNTSSVVLEYRAGYGCPVAKSAQFSVAFFLPYLTLLFWL